MSKTGLVSFSVPALPDQAGQVVEVRDASLRLMHRVRPTEQVELEAGMYVTSVVLPDGQAPEELITVAPGSAARVSLGPQESYANATEDALDASLHGQETKSADPAYSSFSSLGPQEAPVEAPGAAQSAPIAAPSHWFGRFLRIPDGIPVAPPPSFQFVAGATQRSEDSSDFLCTPSTSGVHCLQVAVSGSIPVNCVLPMLWSHGSSIPSSCRVRVIARSGGVKMSATPVSPFGWPAVVEAVASYLVTGHLHHAAQIAGNARDLLLDKVRDPIGAALGGYALLRLGQLSISDAGGPVTSDDEMTKTWATNLANWFPELPDGAVIAGELTARSAAVGSDDYQQAYEWMRRAATRGVPVFADGLSLLCTRLREWRPTPSQSGEAPVPTSSRRPPWFETPDEAIAIERVLAASLAADFTQLTASFPGLEPSNPHASPEPFTDFDPAKGWLPFLYWGPHA